MRTRRLGVNAHQHHHSHLLVVLDLRRLRDHGAARGDVGRRRDLVRLAQRRRGLRKGARGGALATMP